MKLIPLTQGKFAMVDDEDYAFLMEFNWFARKDPRGWYAVRNSTTGIPGKRKQRGMHMLLFFYSKDVDHIDGNGLNNCKGNLRFATRGQNLRNQKKRIGSYSSSFKGVLQVKNSQKWVAQIYLSRLGRNFRLGTFPTEKEAAMAYDVAAIKYFKDFARPNFPVIQCH